MVPRPGREVAIVAIVSHTTPSSDLTDTVSWKPAGHQEDKKVSQPEAMFDGKDRQYTGWVRLKY